uniref:protein-tyrosine-phosphatase n=1 Tax=Zooxanthella nutricula TaxID=1333877 RepID=A0A7S2QNG6_9DINO
MAMECAALLAVKLNAIPVNPVGQMLLAYAEGVGCGATAAAVASAVNHALAERGAPLPPAAVAGINDGAPCALVQLGKSRWQQWVFLHSDSLWICHSRMLPRRALQPDLEEFESSRKVTGATISLAGTTVTVLWQEADKMQLHFESVAMAAKWRVYLLEVAEPLREAPAFQMALPQGAAGFSSSRGAGGAAHPRPLPLSRSNEVDYAVEGRKLLASVNVSQSAGGGVRGGNKWSGCDPLWQHPKTGATLYVGDEGMARNRTNLRRKGITRIVNCQDSDGANYFQGDMELEYYRFKIGLWRRAQGACDGGEGTRAYWEQYFAFCDEALEAGHHVLVHCLAGAHRAGTAGIAFLMRQCKWDMGYAIKAAQRLRPAINPIGDFPELLQALAGVLQVGIGDYVPSSGAGVPRRPRPARRVSSKVEPAEEPPAGCDGADRGAKTVCFSPGPTSA